jgi:hypothetical protein
MDFDDLVDIIKVIIALLFIFGGSFAKLLRKLSEMQKQGQGQRPPTDEELEKLEAEYQAELEALAPEAEEERPSQPSWRYGDSEHSEEHEEAHEDEEDYDLHDELDTELDRDRLADRDGDEDLEGHEEDAHAEPAIAPPSVFAAQSLESESAEGASFEEASDELVREASELEARRKRIAAQVLAIQRPPEPRVADHRALHGSEVKVASFVRDAIVLDLVFRRKATNPFFLLR